MSCDSGKCDIKKALLIPDDPAEAAPEDRELAEPRSKDDLEYAKLWSETELSKQYPLAYWAEVRGKKHG